jgi:hypothetical protein
MMSKTYHIFFLTLFVFGSFIATAQPDSGLPKPSFGAGGTSINPGTTPSPSTSGINFKPKYTFDENATPEPLTTSKKPSLVQEDNLKKMEYEYDPAWLEREREMKDEYKKNQYFGDFRTKSEKITIMCRDHEYVDGDRVRVLQNDKIIMTDIYLVAEFKKFFVELEPGFNKIEFVALNQGSSGPNTAEFKVLDQNGNVMVHNVWNLATGVKASIIVVQE